MKSQALFSLKDKSKKIKCRLLQFLFGALGVKYLMLNVGKDQINLKLVRFTLPCNQYVCLGNCIA